MNTVTVSRVPSIGSQVIVASGKKAGVTGILSTIFTKWNRSEDKILWRSACIETADVGAVWVKWQHVALKG